MSIFEQSKGKNVLIMNILEVINVTKNYYKHRALDNVNISVGEGSIFGLLGPNGAGKTTLIRIITQITGPDIGNILYKSHPITDIHVSEMGYLPEERGLYRKSKVIDQIIYLSRLKGLPKKEAIKRANEWLKKLNLYEWKDKRIDDLSKGMQQKIQFIVTAIHEPKLLILDEPFSGFDPLNAELIKHEIIQLKNKGATIILSTHNMNSVEELCDDIALIHQSKVVLQGQVDAIKNQHKENIFKVIFEGHIQTFTHALWSMAELLTHQEHNSKITATIRIKKEYSSNKVLEGILPACKIISFTELLPSMNEIFIRTVAPEQLDVKNSLTE